MAFKEDATLRLKKEGRMVEMHDLDPVPKHKVKRETFPSCSITGEDAERLRKAHAKRLRKDPEFWNLAAKIGEERTRAFLGRGPKGEAKKNADTE